MPKKAIPKTKVILNILGEEWKSEGKSILDALNKFDLSWEQIKGKGELRIVQGEKSLTYLTNMIRLRKIFANKVVRAHEARNFEYLLKNNYKTNIPK